MSRYGRGIMHAAEDIYELLEKWETTEDRLLTPMEKIYVLGVVMQDISNTAVREELNAKR